MNAGSGTLQRPEPKLQLGLPHPSQPYIHLGPAHGPKPFTEAHYVALVERDLIYRCWRNIPPLNVMPEPYTLTLNPTELFTVDLLYAKPDPSVAVRPCIFSMVNLWL